MSDVFISYASSDSEFAQNMLAQLHGKYIDAWADLHNFSISVLWWSEIYHILERTNVFVPIISVDWLRSVSCQLQLHYIVMHKKRVIPVLLDKSDLDIDAQLPNFLEKIDHEPAIKDVLGKLGVSGDPTKVYRENWDYVAARNWIFHDEQRGLEVTVTQLVESLQVDAEYTRKHTHYMMNARKWNFTGRKQDDLLRGGELKQALVWLAGSEGKDPAPTDLHRQFIRESNLYNKKQTRSLANRLRTLLQLVFPVGPRKIFLSYRRDDSADATGRIYDQLTPVFGEKNVFLDVDTIDYGTDFSRFIQDTLTECFAVLAVIGPDWLEMLKERESNDEVDYVKIELELSLMRHHINVIPILVRGASMPSPDGLPPTLRNLPMMNGKEVRAGRDFHHDMNILIRELKALRKNARSVD